MTLEEFQATRRAVNLATATDFEKAEVYDIWAGAADPDYAEAIAHLYSDRRGNKFVALQTADNEFLGIDDVGDAYGFERREVAEEAIFDVFVEDSLFEEVTP